MLGAHFQAELDGFLNRLQRFRFCPALTDAAWNRRTLDNLDAVLITIKRYKKFHAVSYPIM
jgi:hypothetical protein